MRICSFLPSATEMLFALGLADSVVGVTFECDFPPEAASKPVVVRTRLKNTKGAAAIDREVSEFVARGESLYRVDVAKLRELQPDLIVTQDLCHVCAASPDDLAAAMAVLSPAPRVLTLSPKTLGEVWNDIVALGDATGRGPEALRLVRELEERIARVKGQVQEDDRRQRVLCLEWLDPPFIAGHWMPEMVALAGGEDVLGKAGKPGYRTSWETIREAEPEAIIIMPCGYHLEEAVLEFRSLHCPPALSDTPAVRAEQIYAVDASSFFSRPGPRLATGVEILARILHPERQSAALPARALERL